ncbi:hypothetical protein [Staphylococcus pseudintermedius]|uniref:hypothetical protein n=1 Tax=Staphylococcus pseudintermedius TaxID=283734 RepID=UPI001BDE4E1A|nr:hypothetical protein [Staphylococcus pseudintermedius]
MIISLENIETLAEELGYKCEDLKKLEKNEYMMSDKDIKIKRLGWDCWLSFEKTKPEPVILIPWKAERDNKRRQVWRQFMNCCNYTLRYGEERTEAIAKGIDESMMIEIVSDHKFISQQIKKTTTPLSEDNGFTKTLDKIADYILFSKFDNKEQEEEHIKLKKQIAQLESKKKTEKIKDKLFDKKSKKKDTPYANVKRLKSLPSQYLVINTEDDEAQVIKPDYIINYTRVDRQMEKGKFDESMEAFWERFSPSKPNEIPFYDKEPINYKELAFSTMEQYIAEIQQLEDKPFSPNRAKVISNLKGEMREALKVLRKVIHFQPSVSIDEVIPDDAWDCLSLRDPEVYRILLLNYSELYEKYKSKVNTNMWTLLRTFESLVEKTKWRNKEEECVADLILNFDISSLNEIKEELDLVQGITLPNSTLSKIINTHIPSRIASTYEKQLEDWIWIHRRKGKYKTCSSCGEVKLAVDTRYFKPRKDSKDGLQGICRDCIA